VGVEDEAVSGPGGLLQRLAVLTDPRKRRGVRHTFVSLVAITAAALVSGARSLTAVGEFARELSAEQLARLGARPSPYTGRYTPPDETTLRRVLQRLDPGELDRLVGDWLASLQSTSAACGAGAMAVDGKTLRGAVGPDGRQVHLFAALLHQTGTVMAQRRVDDKTNEISELAPLLEEVDLAGRVVTADALHTQVEHARWLVENKQADYLLTVKDNQPSLVRSIDRLHPEAFSPRVLYG
jgi:hypothetical protein